MVAASPGKSPPRRRAQSLSSIVTSSSAARLRREDLAATAAAPPVAAQHPPPDPAAVREADESLTRALLAESRIKTSVIAAATASAVPIPLFDIAAVAAIQLRMIQKLSELYGRPFSERLARNVVTALGGGALGFGAGTLVAISLTKTVPGIGWMLGVASLPAVAGATTYAIGRVFAHHYERGGSLFDLSPDAFRAHYRREFEAGKRLAVPAASPPGPHPRRVSLKAPRNGQSAA